MTSYLRRTCSHLTTAARYVIVLNMNKNLAVILSVVLGLQVIGGAQALADTGTYGGTTTIKNASITVEKEVRKVDGGHFDWKVEDVRKGQRLEFRITVKNTGETTLTDINVKDSMPHEIATDDRLEFTIKELGVGESESFLIEATPKNEVFTSDAVNKTVINKVTAKTGDLEASATAVVSFGKVVLGLPATGPAETLALTLISGLLLTAGTTLRKIH